MYQLYNTQSEITTNLSNFIKNVFPNIRKTHLNIIPSIIYGMIMAESSVSRDISNHLKDQFSLIQLDSVTKKIRRFFNNELFDPYTFYDHIMRDVISKFKSKHHDSRIHIILDHMYSHNNYTVFMITMRLGKQGIPLWFRCFKGKNNSEAFHEQLLIEGVNYVHNLFDSSFNLIFLADRWFNSTSLMKHIDSLSHTFCFRLKKNIKVLVYDKKEGHKVWKWLDDLKAYQYHSNLFENICITDNLYPINLAISKRHVVSDIWLIATNGDTKRAIKDYGYRYGAIECVFKNQKSNGFYIESINNATLKSFTNMYTLVCFSTLFLTIIGADYSKNKKCYRKTKITTHKNYTDKGKIRVLSLFNTGLTLFKLAVNSLVYIRIPYTFTLYDV